MKPNKKRAYPIRLTSKLLAVVKLSPQFPRVSFNVSCSFSCLQDLYVPRQTLLTNLTKLSGKSLVQLVEHPSDQGSQFQFDSLEEGKSG